MKKFLFMIGIALLMTMAQMQSVSGAQSDGYIHKNHYYAVSFDGEGDAIVRAVIDIENTLGTPIKWIDLELPGQVIVYKAVQEAPSRHVIEYEKQLLSESTILRLELKEPIQQRGTGTIVLFYKIPRYANQDIGGNYKFDFETDNVSYTPELYNVSLDYTLLDNTPPLITLNSPENNFNTSLTNIYFNFTSYITKRD